MLGQLMTYVKEIWQYRWYAAMCSWFICLAGWTAVYFIPNSYEAGARIYVDTQTILRPLLSGLAVQLNVEQQVLMLTRNLLNRANVEKIIHIAGLDANVKTPEEKEALVGRLARQIDVKSVGKDNVYSIAYADRSPDDAKKVVQALLTVLVESSLRDKRKDKEQARHFLDEQINTYEQKLVQAENAIKEFKQKNLSFSTGQGPGQDYFSRLAEANTALSSAKLALQEAENARDARHKQLLGDAPDADSDREPTASPELEARILALRKNLDNMRLNFTEAHPDIVGTKRVLAQLEEQKKQEIEQNKRGGKNGRVLRQSPAYQSLRLAQAEAEANVASLRARVSEYERRYTLLKAVANQAPQIEAEFTQLARDYDINKQNYDQLLKRRESLQISGDFDDSTGAADFRIIDPPRAPSSPTSPNRFLLMSAVLLAGVLGGVALAFVLSQVNPTFTDRRTLRESTGLPILGAVSMIWTDQERKKRKKNFAALATSYAGLLVAYGGILTALALLARQA